MRGKSQRWNCAAAALAVAVATGCSRDATTPAAHVAGPAAPAARIAEGARVRLTLHDALERPGADAASAVRLFPPVEAEGVVLRGRAEDARCGALLAGTAGGLDGERAYTWTDDEGHAHRLVLDGGRGRGPLVSARYERDGESVIEAAYAWERREGGAVLREQTITLRRNGRVVLRHVRHAGAVDVTPAPAAADPGGLPAILRMEMPMSSCVKEWAVYIGASATLIVTGEVFVLVHTPEAAAAVLTAVTAWTGAFNSLVNCLTINAGGA